MKLSKPLLLCSVVLALAACGGVDPDSPMGKRQALFKQMLKTSEDLGGMLRGRLPFDEARFVAGAEQLDKLSRQPWQHFPQVRDEGDSRAKDEVWQRQERFQQRARQLEGDTALLRELSQRKPLDPKLAEPAVKKVEDSCRACHEEFRAY